MSKIDDFKKFVSSRPEVIDYVKSNNTSWQKLYELYDIYGENKTAWEKYLTKSDSSLNIKSILNTLKNVNLDTLEDNISSIQKAVGLVEEFTKDDKKEKEEVKPKREPIDTLYNEGSE